ncbi:hypothetical protein EJ08DRAFT_731475 [Tothia fuscella]|uniref:Uncharacterized protein n=1 Tax=Tothia fuscella TaxID=1048955 RepID=A0A9P4NYB1_9PEZI|nr:hypothetical protein EJ08DRAFT_731475 [Tothia fuscella]
MDSHLVISSAFPQLSTVFKLVEIGMQSKEVLVNSSVFVELVAAVEADLEHALAAHCETATIQVYSPVSPMSEILHYSTRHQGSGLDRAIAMPATLSMCSYPGKEGNANDSKWSLHSPTDSQSKGWHDPLAVYKPRTDNNDPEGHHVVNRLENTQVSQRPSRQKPRPRVSVDSVDEKATGDRKLPEDDLVLLKHLEENIEKDGKPLAGTTSSQTLTTNIAAGQLLEYLQQLRRQSFKGDSLTINLCP